MKRLRPALLIVLLLLLWPTGAGAAAALPRGALADELVIKLRLGAALSSQALARGPHAVDLNRLLRSAGAGVARELVPGSDTYRMRVRPDTDLPALIAALSANPDVAFVEPNHIRTMMRTQQWTLRDIHAYAALDITTGGDVTIALLDTGVSFSHPDLKSKLLRGRDLYNNDDDPSDDEGHGTYTAGVAAAATDNGAGIAGICWG